MNNVVSTTLLVVNMLKMYLHFVFRITGSANPCEESWANDEAKNLSRHNGEIWDVTGGVRFQMPAIHSVWQNIHPLI